MNLGSWLPQVIALLPSAVVAAIGIFSNRKKRVMNELDKLLDLRERCGNDSAERANLDAAVASVSDRLSATMRRRIDPSGVAAVVFVGFILLTVMYFVWLWAFESGFWLIWILAFVVSFFSLAFLAAGIPKMFKTDGKSEKVAQRV